MNTTGGPGNAGGEWTIIVPVKALERAKSRLAPTLSPENRRALVVAMATDVITVCRDTPGVSRVRIIGSDPEIARIADEVGVEFVVDPTGRPTRTIKSPAPVRAETEDSLNTALTWAMAGVRGPVGVVAADLPELESHLFSEILESATRHLHSIVTDHRGRGTTMAFWTGSTSRTSLFGPDSADRYRRLGGAEVIGVDGAGWGEAARDVDIPEDVADLAGRRVGPTTGRALRGVPVSLRGGGGTESVTMVR